MHFEEFKHPGHPQNVKVSKPKTTEKKKPKRSNSLVLATSSENIDETKKETKDEEPLTLAYRKLLQIYLAKHTLSAEDKRILRAFRRENNITNEVHNQLVLTLGWTLDEFEDGEKVL